MKLITSSSPHIRSGETTRRLMGTVLLALLPTLAAGVWFFGLRALLLTLVSVASCVASEWAFRAVTKYIVHGEEFAKAPKKAAGEI